MDAHELLDVLVVMCEKPGKNGISVPKHFVFGSAPRVCKTKSSKRWVLNNYSTCWSLCVINPEKTRFPCQKILFLDMFLVFQKHRNSPEWNNKPQRLTYIAPKRVLLRVGWSGWCEGGNDVGFAVLDGRSGGARGIVFMVAMCVVYLHSVCYLSFFSLFYVSVYCIENRRRAGRRGTTVRMITRAARACGAF